MRIAKKAKVDREQVISKLREHASELQASGLLHLHLFGSLARNEATPNSDVDLLADFDPNKRVSLLTLSALQIQLSELLGVDVDLSSSRSMKEPVRSRALQDSVNAF